MGSRRNGNVFITYAPVDVSWSRKNRLVIEHGGGQIFKQVRRYRGIEISY